MMEDTKEPAALKQVTIFTDGAAVPNPGAGGYGVVLRFGTHRKELSGGFRRTTNNRMELTAVEKHLVQMVWVKGHAGLADNERCDVLAMAACRVDNLPSDPGYVEAVSKEPAGPKVLEKGVPKGTGKLTAEGQPCRKCGTPVVKRVPRRKKIHAGQAYYFAWYLHCPGCKAIYMAEEAKEQVSSSEQQHEVEAEHDIVPGSEEYRFSEQGKLF